MKGRRKKKNVNGIVWGTRECRRGEIHRKEEIGRERLVDKDVSCRETDTRRKPW